MPFFHDVRLDEDIETGAKGGPVFKTVVLGALSGREQRNIEWQYPRHVWNLGYGMQTREQYMEVVSFFYARRGRGYGFRFKDWTDYTSGNGADPEDGDNADNRALIALATGGTAFQLYKFYADSGATFTRKITRPVDGTTRIWVNDVEVTATGAFTVSLSGGIVTFAVAPSGGSEIEAFFHFDVPVRFDIDNLEINVKWWNAATVPDITIVELRE